MTDRVTALRQDLTAITEHAGVALLALDHEDALLSALSEMDAASTSIRNQITARLGGHT